MIWHFIQDHSILFTFLSWPVIGIAASLLYTWIERDDFKGEDILVGCFLGWIAGCIAFSRFLSFFSKKTLLTFKKEK